MTGNTANVTTHTISSASARYVRLSVVTPTSNGDTAARIYEVEVYQPNSNVALGMPITSTAACATTEGPEKAVDGSTGTKWCSGASARWLRVDLGMAQTVSKLVVRHAAAGGENAAWNTKDFSIEVSNDDSQWTQVASVAGNTASVTNHSIIAITARYVRLSVATPTSNGDSAARIYEFEIYR